MDLTFSNQREISDTVPVTLDQVRHPNYGRYLEEYVPGQVFVHPRGFTFTAAGMLDFARAFMQMNPIYLNQAYAKSHGFEDIPASPQMVFNVVLSLGVQNDSEKVIANLGYYDAQFLRPVYPGDTITAFTKVIDRKERGEDKPGIVTILTLGMNQNNQVVLQYTRKLMVAYRGDRPETVALPEGPIPEFPWVESPAIQLPDAVVTGLSKVNKSLTGQQTYAGGLKTGEIILHSIGRTVTDEHFQLTYQVGNTHPLHYDKVFSQSLSGKMSGEPIVYGGLVFAWLEGLASRDVSENAICELGFTEGYHTQPVVSGDTVSAISRVLSIEEGPAELNGVAKIVSFQFIGVKNIDSRAALEEFGEDLFVKENNKKKLGKEKIPLKIFEIERRLLIKA